MITDGEREHPLTGSEGVRNIDSRPVSSVERLLYRAPYCDIIMMGRFDGEISERQLREALLKCRAKYPLTGAHVVQDAEGGAQFIFDDVSAFGIRVVNRKSESEWFELAWNEQKQPFNFSRGPLIRFLLLTSNEISDLVVICHHSICDGLSLTYLLRDIGLFLSQPETRVEPTPLPPLMQEGNLITNLHVGWLYRTMTSRLNRSWDKEKVLFNDDDYEKMYRDYWRSTDVGA